MKSLNSHVHFARQLTRLMDIRFTILGIRFGVDPLLDIIPGFGNILATATSCYLFWIAYRLKVPMAVYARMARNIAVDYLFGVVPYIGIFFDLLFRSNIRNFNLLEKYFDTDILEGEIVE